MPIDSTSVTQRPQMRDTTQSPQLQVQAQPHQYIGALPQNGELDGLLRGLSALSPGLGSMMAAQASEDQRQALEKKKADQTGADAEVAQTTDPAAALRALPAGGRPGLSPDYRERLNEGLGRRVGIGNKQDALTEFAKVRSQPDFDARQWLAQKRQAALVGLTDNHAIAAVGRQFDELDQAVMNEVQRDRVKQLGEVVATNIASVATDTFTANMTGEQMAAAMPHFTEDVKALGGSAKEAASYAFLQLQALSNKAGGMPELFDVFDQALPDGPQKGRTLRQLNPGLSADIDSAKQQALAARDKRTMNDAQRGNAVTLLDLNRRADAGTLTEDEALQHYSQFGALQSPQQYVALMARNDEAKAKQLTAGVKQAMFDQNTLFRLPEGEQQKVLEENLSPVLEDLRQGVAAGDAHAIAETARQLMLTLSAKRSSVTLPSLENLIKTNVTNVQRRSGPSPEFLAMAEVYKALSENPQFRDQYFSGDTRTIMETFTQGGTDQQAAYEAAYRAISPEVKAAHAKYTQTTEFQQRVQEVLKGTAAGSSWWPRILGGNGRPEVTAAIAADVQQDVRQYLQGNPYATDEDVQGFLQQTIEGRYVMDTTTHQLVKVPQGMGGEGTSEALSGYSERLATRLKLSDRSDADWHLTYVPSGTEGTFNVLARSSKGGIHSMGAIQLSTILANDRARKVLQPDELAELGAYRDALDKGQFVQVRPETFAKASMLGVLKEGEVLAYRERINQQFMDRLNAIPKMDLGRPQMPNLRDIPRGSKTISNKDTAQAALAFMNQSGREFNSQPNLAASLVTMGEGLALRAYEDPAQGAGKNIGMGYNLKANAATVDEDLKRAGVDPSMLAAVKSGERDLTWDQAIRLLQIALPRYEKKVKDVAEAATPGLYDRMTPSQRAVMTDIAWQVGSPGQFRKAWEALAKGDMDTFRNETKVFYTDRNGVRKEDTRRGALRAAMLAGPASWTSVINQYGALPADRLDALSMAH